MSSTTSRRIVLAFKVLLISAVSAAQTSTAVPTQFNDFTIAQLQAEMSSGRPTSEKLTQFYLNRIFALDQGRPGVNSVIQLNPDALALARSADAMRRNR